MTDKNNNTHAWPAARRLGSMSDAALEHDEAHPYDAYAGYLDADSGLETEPVLPHAWPPLNKRLAGGLGEQSIDFKVEDKRAPRDPEPVVAFWNVYRAAKDCGFSDREACAFGDKAAETARAAVAAASFARRTA